MLKLSIQRHFCYFKPTCSRYFCSSEDSDYRISGNHEKRSSYKNIRKETDFRKFTSSSIKEPKPYVNQSVKSIGSHLKFDRPLEKLLLKIDENSPNFDYKTHESIAERHIFRDVGKPNCFKLGTIKTTVSIQKSMVYGYRNMTIIQYDKTSKKHLSGLWIGILAAQDLLEKLDEFVEAFEDCEPYSSEFSDPGEKKLIKMRIVKRNSTHGLKIVSHELINDKSTAIFIPSEGMHIFKKCVASVLRNETTPKKERKKNFQELTEVRNFLHGPKIYHFFLSRYVPSNNVLARISEFNKKTQKKSDVYMPIKDAPAIFGLLKEASQFIESYKEPIPVVNRSTQPSLKEAPLYAKSFTNHDTEHMVEVYPEKRAELLDLDRMILFFHHRKLIDTKKKSLVIIHSNGLPGFLQRFDTILREYERLKPSLHEIMATPQFESTDNSSEQEPTDRIFEKFPTLTFLVQPYRVFLEVRQSRQNLLMIIELYNVKTKQKHRLYVPATGIKALIEIVVKAKTVIDKYEGRLPKEAQPGLVLFQEGFVDDVREFMVKVLVAEDNQRKHGDMKLLIERVMTYDKGIHKFIWLHSGDTRGLNKFTRHLDMALKESEKWKCLNDSQFKKDMDDVEANLKAEIEELEKNWTGSISDLFVEKLQINVKYEPKKREVYIKHGLEKYLNVYSKKC